MKPGWLHALGWLVMAALVGLLTPVGCAHIRPPARPPDFERVLVVTGYCDCGRCCGWHRNWRLQPVSNATGRPKAVGITASGTRTGHGTVAAPPEWPFGTIVYVEGYGYGIVEDRGRDIKGNRLDLWFRTHGAALKWGKQTLRVKIWFPPGAKIPSTLRRG